jgi:hypothetical protein
LILWSFLPVGNPRESMKIQTVRASTWLRIAAILTALWAIGHTSGIPWTPGEGQPAEAVVSAMRTVRFEIFGRMRTYWDFYQGFGLTVSVAFGVQAVLLWQQASIAKMGVAKLRPLVIVQLIGFVFYGAVAAMYIFPVPVVFAGAVIVCLTAALVRLGSAAAAG